MVMEWNSTGNLLSSALYMVNYRISLNIVFRILIKKLLSEKKYLLYKIIDNIIYRPLIKIILF